MKIAIAGAHRVGKTTLAEDLQEHLPGYSLQIEPYYALEEAGYTFSEMPDVDDFIKQFDYSIRQIGEGKNNIIFDRCPVDILAYIHATDQNKNIQLLFDIVQKTIEEIDLLVWVPIEVPDLIPCQPSDLPGLRHRVNDILSEWIWDFNIATIEVSGTLQHRRDQILARIF